MGDGMFSKRASPDFTPNRQASALADLLALGVSIIDLTLSNPTDAGFDYPDSLLIPLSGPESLRYQPSPLGLRETREAVSREYARRGSPVPVERVVLTASSSEAYSFLFKLLCDPGDEVLVPVPSYPLFEHLTRFEHVRSTPYPLEYHGRWSIDLFALRRALSPMTRAVLVVSPNNPTGSFVTAAELEALSAICAEHDLALVGDEVFADYAFDDASPGPSVLRQEQTLAFSLGGLSKSAGLPQLKLGWIAASGPESLVTESLTRLELICDTYLSVSTPVQHAAASLLTAGAAVREQIRERCAANRREVARLLRRAPDVDLLRAEGGWSAVLRIPTTRSEQQVALELLKEDHVLVHPGYFFDFTTESFIVVSLLPPTHVFVEGVERLLTRASLAGKDR
jgi:aspartate/methionine/tyrosine aminotransferase